MIGLYLVKFRVLDCEEWRYKFAIEMGKLSVASLVGGPPRVTPSRG